MKHSIKQNQIFLEFLISKSFHKIMFVVLILFLATSSFSQDTQPNKKVYKDVVSDLKVSLTTDLISIELNWTPPADEGEVIIARSNEVIDTAEKLGVSDSLGRHNSDKVNIFNYFKDQNLRPGEYFYAIVLVSQIKKKRVKLIPGVNYSIAPVIVPDKANKPIPATTEIAPEAHTTDFVDNLKIRNIDNTVRLNWTPPLNADKNSPKYIIYRSFEPMQNIGLMEKATKIGEVSHPINTFLDIQLDTSQTIYYGVSVSIEDKEKLPLHIDKSFRKFYFVKSEKTDPEEVSVISEKKNSIAVKNKPLLQVENLSVEIKNDGKLITWSAPESAVENSSTYYVYESNQPFLNKLNSKITEKTKRIGTVVHPDTFFFHATSEKLGISYYGVTVKNGEEEENTILKEGQSYVKIEFKPEEPLESEKIVKKKLKKKETPKEEEKSPAIVEELNPDFDTIMKQYYKKDKFKEALVKFKSLADRTSDNSMRGKSLFFAALCYYNLSEYNSALKILLKEEVQMNYDKERIDFYVKRCLEKRGTK